MMVSEFRARSFTSVFYFIFYTTQTSAVLPHSTINTIHINHSVKREKHRAVCRDGLILS